MRPICALRTIPLQSRGQTTWGLVYTCAKRTSDAFCSLRARALWLVTDFLQLIVRMNNISFANSQLDPLVADLISKSKTVDLVIHTEKLKGVFQSTEIYLQGATRDMMKCILDLIYLHVTISIDLVINTDQIYRSITIYYNSQSSMLYNRRSDLIYRSSH